MAGSRKQRVISSFYCISCGKRGIPIWREKAHIREKGHRKALYCLNCRTIINHIEVRTQEERDQFLEDFADGKYVEEALRSIAHAKEKEDRERWEAMKNERGPEGMEGRKGQGGRAGRD